MKLKSKQEEIFEVEKEVACRSVTVKNMVDDTGLDCPVPLPMVDSKILVSGAVPTHCPPNVARQVALRTLSRQTIDPCVMPPLPALPRRARRSR